MQNQDLLIFLLLALFAFILWNRATNETFTNVSADKPVEPATIQSIVNSIQAKVPDLYPIQTVYVNPFQGSQGSQVYNARILFLNTRGYFGVQYDVQADANGNIISLTEQPAPNVTGPFMAYKGPEEYRSYDDIQASLEAQLKSLKSTDVSGIDKFLEDQRLYQRAAAFSATRSPNESISATTKNQGYIGPDTLALSYQ